MFDRFAPVTDNAFSWRRKKLIESCKETYPGCDAVLVGDATDIHYLTGVSEGISWLIVSGQTTLAISRHMLVREVSSLIPDCEVLLPVARSTDPVELERYVVGQLRMRSFSNAVLDPSRISAASWLRLADACAGNRVLLQAAPRIVTRLRALKDSDEIETIRRCIEMAESSLQQLIRHGASGFIGRSEREIAVELERIMIDHGADRQGFPGTGIIIASGPNSASAHHRPGSRRICTGDPVLIDWGAEWAGYRSDMTRTFFMRNVPEFAIAAYPVVEQAMGNAVALLRPGQTLDAVDQAARNTIIAAGFEEFHYGVGHGVGLEIHEEPWIRSHSPESFLADMITTIEPGIYLHGVGGIRIENMFHVHPNGANNLCSLPTLLEDMILS
jgi:Xaa-Pro aminopeptidase